MDGWGGDPWRSALMQAGLRVFATEGFWRATPQRLAREARVAVGTLYSRFDGREGLARSIIRDLDSELSWAVTRDGCLGGSGWARFRAMLRAVFEFAAENPEAAQILFFYKHAFCVGEHTCGGEIPSGIVEWMEELDGGAHSTSALRAGWVWSIVATSVRAMLSGTLRLSAASLLVTEAACRAVLGHPPDEAFQRAPQELSASFEEPAEPDVMVAE